MFDFPNSPTTGDLVTTPDGSTRQWDGSKWVANTGAGAAFAFLPLTGGTLTGMLTLSADPTANLHAATKRYLNNKYFPLAGGILTGHVYMATTPTIPADAGYAAMLSVRELVMDGGATAPHIAWNSYLSNVPSWKYRATGYAAQDWLDPSGYWGVTIYPSSTAGTVMTPGTATGWFQLTQTGLLNVNGKGQFSPALLAAANANPCVTCWNTGGGIAMGMWCQSGALYLGNTDGGGVPTTVRASLDQSGNFNATGNVSAVGVSASGQVTATGNIISNGGALYPGNAAAGSKTYLAADANYATLCWQPNYAIQFRRSDGLTIFLSPSAPGAWAMTLDYSGTLSVRNGLTVTNDVTANRFICTSGSFFGYTASPNWCCYASGTTRMMQWLNSDWQWTFDGTSGNIYYGRLYSGNNSPFMIFRTSDSLIYNNCSYLAGYGAYIDYSDLRGKSSVSACDKGMDVIRDLRPVEFVQNLDRAVESPRGLEIGFIAQDVQKALPEAVIPMGIELEDGTGTLDDDEPTLGLTTGPIVAVMVNAVKEMDALLRDLTARIAGLEARKVRS